MEYFVYLLELNNGLIIAWGYTSQNSIIIDYNTIVTFPVTFSTIYNFNAFAYRQNNAIGNRCFFTTCVNFTRTTASIGWFKYDGGAQYINYICIGS